MKELSLQLYSVKDAFEDTSKVQENFEKIAEMGYTGVEFAGFYGLPKEEMKKIQEILECTGLYGNRFDTEKTLKKWLEP